MHEEARSKADPAASVSTSGAEWRLDLAPAAAAARLRGRGRRRRWAALPADPGRGVDKTQSGARLAARRRSRGSPRGAWRGRGRSRPAHAHAPIYARPLTRTHTLHVYTYTDMDLYAHTLPDSVHDQFDLVSLKWLMNQIPKCSSSTKSSRAPYVSTKTLTQIIWANTRRHRLCRSFTQALKHTSTPINVFWNKRKSMQLVNSGGLARGAASGGAAGLACASVFAGAAIVTFPLLCHYSDYCVNTLNWC